MGKRRNAASKDGEGDTTISDDDVEMGEKEKKLQRDKDGLAYFTINEIPPWYMCIIFGFQHYLTMFGSNYLVPILVSTWLCVGNDVLSKSEILNTAFFASGLATVWQCMLGTRLPIIQGGTFSYLVPTFAILSLERWKCPEMPETNCTAALLMRNSNASLLISNSTANVTLDREVWQVRMREIQGAIIVSSLFQIVIGFTGLFGLILRFISPMVVTVVITLVGISLFDVASDFSSGHWGIAMTVVGLVVIFSQYMAKIEVPCLGWSRKGGCRRVSYRLFQLFPVVLSVGLVWLLCYILTITDVFPADCNAMGYKARTDIRTQVLTDAQWFRFPQPFQWGTPTVSASSVFGMLAGVLAGIIESVGDYYACARVSGAPPPPVHAINRGIGMEGIGCLFAGLIGTGNAVTSYSENVGAIGLTKVGSRVVVLVGAFIIILFSLVGKFGALFVSMPDPITGGLFFVSFGMIVGVGLSNLSYVNMNSSRNIFVLGFSLLSGLSIPRWLSANPGIIETGVFELNQILNVLLTTSMFLGGVVAAFLDNTIPGTSEERGLRAWKKQHSTPSGEIDTKAYQCYEIPQCSICIRRVRCFSFLPFCPTFKMRCGCCDRCRKSQRKSEEKEGTDNPYFTNVAEMDTAM